MAGVLELRGVTKRFGGLTAVRNVSFTLNDHEILFVIGPNGAGKTTVFNLISGFFHPDEGAMSFGGNDVSASRRTRPPASELAGRFRS